MYIKGRGIRRDRKKEKNGMKYTVSINSKVSYIVDDFDDLILKNKCRFDWVPLSSVAVKFTVEGDGRKIRPRLQKMFNGFGNAKFEKEHLF